MGRDSRDKGACCVCFQWLQLCSWGMLKLWWSDWQTYLGCEVKSESVWSNQGASLVCLAKDLAEGKVQGVGACVVVHD